MAGSITVSSITLDSDNNFSIKSNTGATLFFANTLGIDVANSIGATAITNDKILSVANTKISGNIISSQITSVANTQLTGLIEAAQIGSANATLVTSGTLPKARLPTGSVLQVVQGTTATQTSTTSNSFQSTGLTASITPSSASNKVLVIATSTFVGTTLTDILTAIFRGDTSTGTNVSGSNLSTKYNSQASENASVTNQYLDSPSTTSSQTYTFAFKSSASGQTVTAQSASITAVMILMEIAA